MRLVFSPLLVVILHVEDDISVLPLSVKPGQQPQHCDGAELTVKLTQLPHFGSEAALSEHLRGGW